MSSAKTRPNPNDPKTSGVNKCATPTNMQGMHDAIASIPQVHRRKLLRAMNLAGYQRNSTIAAWVGQQALFALSYDLEKVSGYHWTHQPVGDDNPYDPYVVISALPTKLAEFDTWYPIVHAYVSHPDKTDQKRNIRDVAIVLKLAPNSPRDKVLEKARELRETLKRKSGQAKRKAPAKKAPAKKAPAQAPVNPSMPTMPARPNGA